MQCKSDDYKEGNISWTDLSIDEQTVLLEDYGHYLDGLPPTCDMRTKQERLQAWLAEKISRIHIE